MRGASTVTHVLTPDRRRSQRGLRIHSARGLGAGDVTRRDGIPVTSVPRTLVDLGTVLGAEQLANVIHEAAFRGWFDETAARGALARANGHPGAGVLQRALDAHASGSAGTRSGLEDRFLALVRAADLPEPLVNVRIAGIEVDLHWPDRRLCVEIDGAAHGRPRTRREDGIRDWRLGQAGYEVIRIPGDDVDLRPGTAIARVRARLGG